MQILVVAMEIMFSKVDMATRKNRRNSRKQEGGRRKRSGTRKLGRKASDWSAAVKRVYQELKRKNPSARLGDAMKEASKRKKNGTL